MYICQCTDIFSLSFLKVSRKALENCYKNSLLDLLEYISCPQPRYSMAFTFPWRDVEWVKCTFLRIMNRVGGFGAFFTKRCKSKNLYLKVFLLRSAGLRCGMWSSQWDHHGFQTAPQAGIFSMIFHVFHEGLSQCGWDADSNLHPGNTFGSRGLWRWILIPEGSLESGIQHPDFYGKLSWGSWSSGEQREGFVWGDLWNWGVFLIGRV